jgi:hypothetical protein
MYSKPVFKSYPLSFILVFAALLLPFFSVAKPIERPKLVVGIVVDQMRYDFLYRYWNKYGNDGFKRLLREGFSFENNQYNYVPTFTGPGHASIYTGTTPATHGIVGNDWYVRNAGKNIYCTEDKNVKTVGSTSVWGEMSPVNLLASTITDELRLATNGGSKVIGVCLKDRGSILPAGHMPNAAYWYDGTVGGWITSTYYTRALPDWVQQFNEKKTAEKYLNQPWTPLLPLDQYSESAPDDNEFENPFKGETKPVFPHNLPVLRGDSYDLLRQTPFGNTFTKDFAIETIKQEKMGRGEFTDFLALSFSSTDYIGHQFGPNAVETEDTYLRLDRDLAEFLKFLDKQIGKKNVLVFLTADHGAAHAPNFLLSKQMPGGSYGPAVIKDSVQQFLNRQYGPGNYISTYYNNQIYLNHAYLKTRKLVVAEVQQQIAQYLQYIPVLMRVVTAEELRKNQWETGLGGMFQRGFLAHRSGDVLLAYQPGWLEGYTGPLLKGTTHGSAGRYDTHVPLIWYGWNVKNGSNTEEVHIIDIAPTLAQWLKIQEPNGCIGKPLQDKMK